MKAVVVSIEDDAAKRIASFANENQHLNIAIVFRKKNFLTALEGFNIQGSVCVLLVAKKALGKLVSNAYETFDFIVTFGLDKNEAKPIWRNLSNSRFEIPSKFLSELVKLSNIPSSRITLIANEEPTLYYAGHERERLNLAGYHASDLARFLDKFAIKKRADEIGVKVAKCIELNDRLRMKPKNEVFELVIQELDFPLFIKPRYGCALVGCLRAKDAAEFSAWLDQSYDEPFPYLIEEQLEGMEVCGYMLLDKGEVLIKKVFQNVNPISDFVLKQLPLGKIEIAPCTKLRADAEAFADKLVSGFNPPNGIFAFQAFCLPDSNGFGLLEVSCRLPGGLFTDLVLNTTGVSVESLHVMLAAGCTKICPELIEKVNSGPHLAYIRYPRQKGIVKKLNEVPPTKCCQKTTWYVSVGQEMENPRALAHRHEACAIELWSTDYQQLATDYAAMLDNFTCIDTA